MSNSTTELHPQEFLTKISLTTIIASFAKAHAVYIEVTNLVYSDHRYIVDEYEILRQVQLTA